MKTLLVCDQSIPGPGCLRDGCAIHAWKAVPPHPTAISNGIPPQEPFNPSSGRMNFLTLTRSGCARLELAAYMERHGRDAQRLTTTDILKVYRHLDLLDKPFPTQEESPAQSALIQSTLDEMFPPLITEY